MRNRLQAITPLTTLLFVFAACGDAGPDEFSATGNTITNTRIAGVTASSHDGNVPENAIDGRMDTRWSAAGAGSWLDVELIRRANVQAVEIAWYRGDERRNDFSILVDDGRDYREVYRGRSSGRSEDFERFDIPASAASNVRVVFHGNTQNHWASISELRVLSASVDDLVPAPKGVNASAHDGNVPANALDGDLDTRWSCAGSCYLQLDLGEEATVQGVKIAWHRGDERTIDFRVQLSADGGSFGDAYRGRSNGRTTDFETFSFAPEKARYVRIASNGNSDNPWNSIAEIEVLATTEGSKPGPGEPGDEPGEGEDEGPVEIVSAVASADDGNVPENVLDGDPDTRWSCEGDCHLDLDLGSVRSFDGIRIAWHRGDERTTAFLVGVSEDGQRFSDAYQGRTTGRTSDFENYVFQSTERGRYVRISASGSTMNLWNSISRVEMIPVGGAEDLPEPEEPEVPGDGSGLDRFGVKMLYPSKPGGEEWYLGEDPNRDDRFDPQDRVTRNSDGSWKMRSDKVRMNVFTSSGYDPDRIRSYNRDTLTRQGYMQDPNDWRNVEMTGYVKLNRTSDRSDNFTWYTRGGRHSSSRRCEGSAVKGSLHYDGRTRVQKESYHVSYEQSSYRNSTSSVQGRWIGFKTVFRNVTVNGRLAVRTELYLDEELDGTSWELVYEHTDSGNFGGSLGSCGGSPSDMPITWGGPVAAFRWDNASDVDFKWMSVREIQP